MTRHFYNKIYLDEDIEKLIKSSEYIGRGNNGVVYKIDDKKIIKIFNDKEVCRRENETLKISSGYPAFPKVYEYGDYYIIRDYVEGTRLDKYLNHNPLNKYIVVSLVELIKSFKALKYTKVDIRCKDLYVQKDYSIKIIDPKDNFHKEMDFPRHLMKGMQKRDSLGEFFYYLYTIDKELYYEWRRKYRQYLIDNSSDDDDSDNV